MRICVLCVMVAALLGPASVASSQVTPPQGPFQQAVERTASLRIYRAALVVRARGGAANPLAPPPPAEERVLTDFSGVYSGGDSQLVYRSTDTANGYDPQSGLQLIVSRGVTYASGPLPVSGATEARWYNFGRRPPSALQPPIEPAAQLVALSEPVDAARLSRTRIEQLDGRSCAVYQGREADALAALTRYGRPIANNPGVSLEQQLASARLERTQYLAWVCNDGYIRQIRVAAAGTVQGRQAQPFALDIQLRITDIGSRALRVAAPRDALPLRPFPLVTLAVVAADTVRGAPAADAPEVGQVLVREAVQLLDRTADNRWYRVRSATATGWLPSTALPTIAARTRLPVAGQAPAAAPTPLPAGTPTTALPSGTPQLTPSP